MFLKRIVTKKILSIQRKVRLHKNTHQNSIQTQNNMVKIPNISEITIHISDLNLFVAIQSQTGFLNMLLIDY